MTDGANTPRYNERASLVATSSSCVARMPIDNELVNW